MYLRSNFKIFLHIVCELNKLSFLIEKFIWLRYDFLQLQESSETGVIIP